MSEAVRIAEKRVFPTFGYDVEDAGDGAKVVSMVPLAGPLAGVQLSFSFTGEAANELGEQLLAPRVQAFSPAQMPAPGRNGRAG